MWEKYIFISAKAGMICLSRGSIGLFAARYTKTKFIMNLYQSQVRFRCISIRGNKVARGIDEANGLIYTARFNKLLRLLLATQEGDVDALHRSVRVDVVHARHDLGAVGEEEEDPGIVTPVGAVILGTVHHHRLAVVGKG